MIARFWMTFSSCLPLFVLLSVLVATEDAFVSDDKYVVAVSWFMVAIHALFCFFTLVRVPFLKGSVSSRLIKVANRIVLFYPFFLASIVVVTIPSATFSEEVSDHWAFLAILCSTSFISAVLIHLLSHEIPKEISPRLIDVVMDFWMKFSSCTILFKLPIVLRDSINDSPTEEDAISFVVFWSLLILYEAVCVFSIFARKPFLRRWLSHRLIRVVDWLVFSHPFFPAFIVFMAWVAGDASAEDISDQWAALAILYFVSFVVTLLVYLHCWRKEQ